MEKKYYSQYEQDKFVDFLLNKDAGTFVDIGANDGITFSNSYFFEKERNWKGLCIEPIPETFSKLKQVRSSTCINCGVWKESGLLKFYKVSGYAEMLSGVVDSFKDEHFIRLKNDIETHGGKVEISEIPVDSLNNILLVNKIKKIDFLSIDTEGSEFEILQAMDFAAVNVAIIAVENQYDESKIRNLLKERSFILVKRFGSDDIFVHSTLWGQFRVRLRYFLFTLKIKLFKKKLP